MSANDAREDMQDPEQLEVDSVVRTFLPSAALSLSARKKLTVHQNADSDSSYGEEMCASGSDQHRYQAC
jgi:hypothetical protein